MPRLVSVADLGKLLEELGDDPHEHRRPEPRPVLHRGQLEARDDSAPVGRRAHEVGDVELRLAEEVVSATLLEADERAEQDADGRGREPADASELVLARVGVEEREQRAQVREIEERKPLLVGVVEDEREALLLGLVRAEDLREQERSEVGHRGSHRNARADSAEREVLDREARQEPIRSRAPRRASWPGRRPIRGARFPRRRPSRRRRTPRRRPPRAARRSPAASSSCRFRSRRRSGRAGSSSGAGRARPPRARSRPRALRAPSSIAAPPVAYASRTAVAKSVRGRGLCRHRRDRSRPLDRPSLGSEFCIQCRAGIAGRSARSAMMSRPVAHLGSENYDLPHNPAREEREMSEHGDERPRPLERDRAAVHAGRRRAPAGSLPRRAHDRAPWRRAPLEAHGMRSPTSPHSVRSRARRPCRW